MPTAQCEGKGGRARVGGAVNVGNEVTSLLSVDRSQETSRSQWGGGKLESKGNPSKT